MRSRDIEIRNWRDGERTSQQGKFERSRGGTEKEREREGERERERATYIGWKTERYISLSLLLCSCNYDRGKKTP